MLTILICTNNGVFQFYIPLSLIILNLVTSQLTLLVISGLLLIILVIDIHFLRLKVFPSFKLNWFVRILDIMSNIWSFSLLGLKLVKMWKIIFCIWFILIILFIIFLLDKIFLIIGIIFLKLFFDVAMESEKFLPRHVYWSPFPFCLTFLFQRSPRLYRQIHLTCNNPFGLKDLKLILSLVGFNNKI